MAQSRNFQGSLVKVTAGATANAEFTVLHELGQVPRGAFVVRQSGLAQWYRSSVAWTRTEAYLKCTLANAEAYIFFFV